MDKIWYKGTRQEHTDRNTRTKHGRDGGRESKIQLNSSVRVASTSQHVCTSRYLEQHVVELHWLGRHGPQGLPRGLGQESQRHADQPVGGRAAGRLEGGGLQQDRPESKIQLN
jgi:hypothetical protein